MLRIQNILKKSLEHKKLPLWNICFHINGLYQISRANTTFFYNFLQFSKNGFSVYSAHRPHFSGRTNYHSL